MLSNFSTTQDVRKRVAETEGGVVASQHSRASRVGAKVLKEGGDAVDAAIATAFALGVLEPWMSGPGGGGAMLIWREKEQRAYALNFGMASPAGLDTADYPLTGQGRVSDLFPWPSVQTTAMSPAPPPSPSPAWSRGWKRPLTALPPAPGPICWTRRSPSPATVRWPTGIPPC